MPAAGCPLWGWQAETGSGTVTGISSVLRQKLHEHCAVPATPRCRNEEASSGKSVAKARVKTPRVRLKGPTANKIDEISVLFRNSHQICWGLPVYTGGDGDREGRHVLQKKVGWWPPVCKSVPFTLLLGSFLCHSEHWVKTFDLGCFVLFFKPQLTCDRLTLRLLTSQDSCLLWYDIFSQF